MRLDLTGSLEDIENFILKTDAARCVEAIYEATNRQVHALGFDCFGYQLLSPPIGPFIGLYMTSMPKGWTLRYIEQNYIGDDLVTRHAARTIRPFLWDDVARRRMMTRTQRAVFDEAEDFGLRSGGTVPIHGPAAAKALFSVSSKMSQDELSRLFLSARHVLQIVATYVHENVLRLGIQSPPRPPSIKLTPRELEVLTWTARGKTAWEISEILSLSEATTRDYAQQACHKLGTNNKTHAVALAMLHALIIP
jgi:LuxR family quorum sensing-dependent transcriptional regulator